MILETIDNLENINAFFFLTELPDDFTQEFQIEQIVQYG